MKKLISILLTASMILTMFSIPFAVSAEAVYEYTETFETENNSFVLGSSWTYDATAQNITTDKSNAIVKFSDPEEVLASAVNYEISAEFVLNPYDLNAIVFKADESYANFLMFRRNNNGNTELFRMGTGQKSLATGIASNLKSNEVNTMKVVVQGNVYTCYMNGVEMLTYTDTEATSNYRVGVRSNVNTTKGHTVTVDNFSVVNLDKPALTKKLDTFENADDWNLGNYWTHNSTSKNISSTASGQLAIFADKDGILADTNDYIISADITTTVASGQHSLVFRQNGSSFYMFRVSYHKAEFFRMGGAGNASLKTGDNAIIENSAGETFNLKVIVNGNTFTGYYNGVEVVSLTDSSFTTGSVGIRSNGGVSVDNFYIERLDANADLKSISINGTAISDFSADVFEYFSEASASGGYPTVSATAVNADLTSGNGITIEQASEVNGGVATITVVSESGKASNTYKVNFASAEGETLDTFENASGWTLGSHWKHDTVNKRVCASTSNGLMSYNDAQGIVAKSNGNYVISADLVFEGGTSIGATSIVFRKQDNNNYYMFRLYGGKGEFYRMGGSGNGQIGVGTREVSNVALGSVMKLTVVANGNKFTGYINGVKMAEATDDEFATGSLGIRSNVATGGTVYADNFYVATSSSSLKLAAVSVPDGSGILINPVAVNNKYYMAVPNNNVYNVNAAAIKSTDVVAIEQTDDFNKPAIITVSNAAGTKSQTYSVYFVEKIGSVIPDIQNYAVCTEENGDDLTFAGTVLNMKNTVNAIAILAVYDIETGELIDIKLGDENTSFAGNFAETPVDYGTINTDKESVEIRMLLWNNLEDVKPLSTVNTFTYSKKKKLTETKNIEDILGITAWGSVYKLDDSKGQLEEMADEIAELNSTKIKVLLGPSYQTAYLYEDFGDTEYETMTDLAQTAQYTALFGDERFDTYAISASEMNQVNWRNGLTRVEREYVENEFYEFASYLLTTYKNTNKTFILQNWEGDNLLQAWEEDLADQTVAEQQNIKFEGFAQYINARQAGVERARKELRIRSVKVVNALEVMAVPAESIGDTYYFKVNDKGDIVKCPLMVDILIGNEPRINPDRTETYMTRVNADLYSISSWHTSFLNYEALQPDGSAIKLSVNQMTNSMAERLNYMSKRALPSDVYGYRNIMIGEFGAKEYYNSANVDGQAQTKMEIAKAQVESFMTVPQLQYAFYWQLYCNGIKDSENNAWYNGKKYKNSELMGGWLIRPDGTKPPMYDYFKGLLTTEN